MCFWSTRFPLVVRRDVLEHCVGHRQRKTCILPRNRRLVIFSSLGGLFVWSQAQKSVKGGQSLSGFVDFVRMAGREERCKEFFSGTRKTEILDQSFQSESQARKNLFVLGVSEKSLSFLNACVRCSEILTGTVGREFNPNKLYVVDVPN